MKEAWLDRLVAWLDKKGWLGDGLTVSEYEMMIHREGQKQGTEEGEMDDMLKATRKFR